MFGHVELDYALPIKKYEKVAPAATRMCNHTAAQNIQEL
jgi:hypothetical protein